MSFFEKGGKFFGGCLGTALIFILVALGVVVIAAGTAVYYSWHNLLSDEPLDIEKTELSWKGKQALKVKLLPAYQGIEKNKAGKFRLALTERETNYTLQEIMDDQQMGAKARVIFDEDRLDLKFTRPFYKLLYLNVEVEATARVKDGNPEVFLHEVCIGYYCPEGYVLSIGSNLVEWNIENRFCSKDSQLFIHDLQIKEDRISLKLETRETHPPELEEGSTVQEPSDL